jgi:hypothetical protein
MDVVVPQRAAAPFPTPSELSPMSEGANLQSYVFLWRHGETA